MQDFEQLTLVQVILVHPGIYLQEIQENLLQMGIDVSLPTICRTFKSMVVTRQAMHHIALQQSDYEQAKYIRKMKKIAMIVRVRMRRHALSIKITIKF